MPVEVHRVPSGPLRRGLERPPAAGCSRPGCCRGAYQPAPSPTEVLPCSFIKDAVRYLPEPPVGLPLSWVRTQQSLRVAIRPPVEDGLHNPLPIYLPWRHRCCLTGCFLSPIPWRAPSPAAHLISPQQPALISGRHIQCFLQIPPPMLVIAPRSPRSRDKAPHR